MYNFSRVIGISAVLLMVAAMLVPADLMAQRGTVFGSITDSESGESLAGATVIIKGTTLGVSTDVDGRYMLRNAPAGDHVLVFSYMGFFTQEIPVTVSEGERIEQNVQLEPDFIQGDEILVQAVQRGQARALTRQRQSVNIRSVVSAEQMDGFGDQTISESLTRIAGMGHGGANIRGVGSGASNITMDGQRMGSTGSDRSVDLSTISSDMVQDMEVIKVITPDMDANALSGTININTRRPVGGERTVNARVGGGWNMRFGGLSGPDTRASFSYGDSPRDDFSYAVNLSYQRDPRASESVSTSWAIRNFGEGPKDVIDDMSTELVLDPRERYGLALQFTFQPTVRSTYHVQGMFNYQSRERMSYGMRINPEVEDYISQTTTNAAYNPRGRFIYNSELDDYDIHQYTAQVGGRHLLDRFNMEYKLGWGHGRLSQKQYEYRFWTAFNRPYEFTANFEDRWSPTLEPGPYGRSQTYPTRNLLELTTLDNRLNSHVDNDFTATIDFESPFSRGMFKFGSSAILTFKKGEAERLSMDSGQTVTLQDFDGLLGRDWRIFNRDHQTYHLPWLIDLQKARDWYYGRFPLFTTDMETWAQGSEMGDFYAHENTFSAYGMGTVEFGRFRFLGGLRLEHTDVRYDGKDGTIDDGNSFRGAVPVSTDNNYTSLFPNAQLVYGLGPRSNIRLAYSRSIGRPTFTQLSPSTLRNYASQRLSEGNPHLKPMLSNNLDLLVEHYFMNVGQFTVGLYYKELSDFVYSFTDIIGPYGIDGEGQYSGWRWSTYLNGEEATVYGLEVSWQQNLSFLPGILGNFGTYANYSYAYSEAELDRPGNTRLRSQRPHVVNAGLDYNQGGFSGQLSYRWGAPSISSYSDLRWVPEIQVQERVYFDSYRDASNELSMTLRYRLTSNFRLWADAVNILNNRSISYSYNRDYYPNTARLQGRRVSLGVRYSF